MNPIFLVSSLGLACAAVIALYRRRSSKSLPPGPPLRFLIGNLFDVPRAPEEWKGYAALGKKYGAVLIGPTSPELIVLRSCHLLARHQPGPRCSQHLQGRHRPPGEEKRNLLRPTSYGHGHRRVCDILSACTRCIALTGTSALDLTGLPRLCRTRCGGGSIVALSTTISTRRLRRDGQTCTNSLTAYS